MHLQPEMVPNAGLGKPPDSVLDGQPDVGAELLGGPVGTAVATVGAGWGVAVGDDVGKAVLTQLQAVQLTGNHSSRMLPAISTLHSASGPLQTCVLLHLQPGTRPTRVETKLSLVNSSKAVLDGQRDVGSCVGDLVGDNVKRSSLVSRVTKASRLSLGGKWPTVPTTTTAPVPPAPGVTPSNTADPSIAIPKPALLPVSPGLLCIPAVENSL